MLRLIQTTLLLIFLASCSGSASKDALKGNSQDSVYMPPSILYSVGMSYVYNADYDKAIEVFKRVQSEYTYAPEAIDASAMLIWVYYYRGMYIDAETTAEALVRNHSEHPYTAWALYMQGLVGMLESNDINRDQSSLKAAIDSFDTLIKRHNNSAYADDAKILLNVVRSNLAEHELIIGRYYQKTDYDIGAILRFQYIIEEHQDSYIVPEAMYRMTVSLLRLGLDEEAVKTVSVMGENYFSDKWYTKSLKLIKRYVDKEVISKLAKTDAPST